jgi:hypothetical protein
MIYPHDILTRAEAATVIFRLLSHDARERFWATENPFADVSPGKWYNNAISTIYAAEIVRGVGNNNFAPYRPITRGQTAMLLANLFEQNNIPITDTGHWAHGATSFALEMGLLLQNGQAPDTFLTRAEFAYAINNLLGRTITDLAGVDQVTWIDNANPQTWYYHTMQIASNSSYGAPWLNWAALQRHNAVAGDVFVP